MDFTGFLPTAPAPVAVVGAVLAGLLAAGPALAGRRGARPAAWAALVGAVAAAEVASRGQPAGFRMLALILPGLVGMKVVVLVEEVAAGMPRLGAASWLGFALAWFGMRPRLFAAPRVPDPRAAAGLARRGAVFFLGGTALLAAAGPVHRGGGGLVAATACALVGTSWALHFGLLNLAAAFWRARGVACEPLFRAPLYAQSLGEFWGKRWNLAFSEMTATALYRPLARGLGRGPALLAAFGLSGLLHEMAISLPVGRGFGGPLAYFLLHGVLVGVERLRRDAGSPIGGPAGRAWTVAWLLLPLPWLFHPAFLAGVVWPMAGITP